jgi:glyoxylase-like metal-dependent hydrolase (beta-lactamase superfamily II)
VQEVVPGVRRHDGGGCSSYVVERGGRALVVDAGEGIGAAADGLPVDWVLHTHHHRDSALEGAALAARGAAVGVPEAEAERFEDAAGYWGRLVLDDRYDCANAFSTPVRSVPVTLRMRDGARLRWQDLEIEVLPTPGHTRGSITLLVDVDGCLVAFCGGLIHSAGHVPTLYDLHWDYSNPDGIDCALHSVRRLREIGPDVLAPAHGVPMTDPDGALAELEDNLGALRAVAGRRFAGDVDVPVPSALRVVRVSEHLLAVTQACAHFYVLLGPDGRALLFDYGFPGYHHVTGAGTRFVEHSLVELERSFGVRRIDVVVPTHYHDDHVAGIAHLHERFGCEVWAWEGFADVLRRPWAHRLPAVWRDPVPVTRTYGLGDVVEWEGSRFTAAACPGHTRYAVALYGEVDGQRVGVTGDEFQLDAAGRWRGGGPVYRNGFRTGSFLRGIEGLAAHAPEVILTGHDGPLEVGPGTVDELRAWARELDAAHAALAPDPDAVDLAIDTDPVRVDPYRSTVAPGAAVTLTVEVANHRPEPARARVTPAPPHGWEVTPAERELLVAALETATASFVVHPAPDAAPGVRHVIALDAQIGPDRLAWSAEALVTVEAESDGGAR